MPEAQPDVCHRANKAQRAAARARAEAEAQQAEATQAAQLAVQAAEAHAQAEAQAQADAAAQAAAAAAECAAQDAATAAETASQVQLHSESSLPCVFAKHPVHALSIAVHLPEAYSASTQAEASGQAMQGPACRRMFPCPWQCC